MKNLSIKLGILFFVIIFSLITSLLFYLHKGIADIRAEEEIEALQARGNSHRSVLEKHFNEDTIDHVVLMESESRTDVVITNQSGEIIQASKEIEQFEKYIPLPEQQISREGQVIENNWKTEPYIATISPIYLQNKLMGYIFMFENTKSVHLLMNSLNEHFLLAGILSVIFTFIIIIFLSKGITKPLITMKEATYQISKGNFSVSFPKASKDELGDLAKSIESLATELNYLKQQRSEFLASISHELRTPLTYIKGYTDIVRKRNLSEEEQKKYLTIISDETNRLSSLIKELFELAKMDQNTFLIHKQNLELFPFLEKIVQKLTPALTEKNIHFTLECEPRINLMADPTKLEQIIINLLDNAIKYSTDGAKIELKAWKGKGLIHLTIEDSGKGIPEKDLPFIFNRFYRIDKSRTRSLGGTGLGLAIVQELVHAHDAEISVTSKEGVGTKFELLFKEKTNEDNLIN
ncbi:HAMP domain-containing sensor histidine kinase [Robertmurraya massiliosenegalensis]|uniref:HAMP domain-containing sensor histidine kinase n=1 Tax=Robertmurraya massiliosenegalensis TaxID=1287657 RepID=UPI0002D9E62A